MSSVHKMEHPEELQDKIEDQIERLEEGLDKISHHDREKDKDAGG